MIKVLYYMTICVTSVNKLLLAAVILLAIGYFSGLSILELRAEEPRRAVVALEMYESGNWLVPTIHGEPYYNKPPFFNWALASAFTIFGNTSEWVVRLPALLAWWATAISLFFLVRRYLSTKEAWLAAFSAHFRRHFVLWCSE